MIDDVLIVGFGAVGALYASKINAKILVDKKRKQYYETNPTFVNDILLNCEYILPDKKRSFDLIIISTKYYDLENVLVDIKNQISEKTIVLSFINGISSENIIKRKYPMLDVIPSYVICDSIIRNNRHIIHNNINTIVIPPNLVLENFFKKHNINYQISNDIKSDMWQKYMLNIVANQLSALTGKTFGELNNLPYIESLIKNILNEVVEIALAEGVNADIQKTINTFKNMAPYGKTSMLQDVENGRKTEIDAFACEIMRLGKKHNINTPYNEIFYALLSDKN